ncbi:MAG: hypothetical protein HQ579_05655 [Candidatus Omnitrophica bacterium]|nr:hypothetical protein [Candidatus Omnitrophota bacterium]
MNKKAFRIIEVIALTTLIFFGDRIDSFAASSNGTRFPKQGAAEFGYEYYAMFRRALSRSYGNLKTSDHFAIVSVGITDWLSLDGKIGMGDLTAKGGIHLPKLEFDNGFSGGYGFRVKFFEHEQTDVRIILGGQHISVHPQDRSIDDDKYESFLDDWQICGVVTKKIKCFSPYVGMKLSDCEFVYKINKHDKKRRYSRYHLGFLFGGDFFLLEEKLRINIEARLFDESGFSAAAAYLF